MPLRLFRWFPHASGNSLTDSPPVCDSTVSRQDVRNGARGDRVLGARLAQSLRPCDESPRSPSRLTDAANKELQADARVVSRIDHVLSDGRPDALRVAVAQGVNALCLSKDPNPATSAAPDGLGQDPRTAGEGPPLSCGGGQAQLSVPVGDEAVVTFAQAFYRRSAHGNRRGRRAYRALGDPVRYGSDLARVTVFGHLLGAVCG